MSFLQGLLGQSPYNKSYNKCTSHFPGVKQKPADKLWWHNDAPQRGLKTLLPS